MYGLSDVAGVFAIPLETDVGFEDWATMSGMSPGHPLVGGYAGDPGYQGGQRQVAIGQAPATMGAAIPATAHYSQVFNLKGNPVGWVLLAALLYYVLNFVHFYGGVSAAARVRK